METVLFLGSAPFSLEILEELRMLPVTVAEVYTQSPKPAGRGRELRKNPVHCWAEAQGIPVQTPSSLSSIPQEAFRCDALVVAAYGLIIPASLLAVPRYGGINVHASLLPRWRGAAPVQRAILAGDTQTGITLMQMEAGVDTGSILATKTVPIASESTAGDVLAHLAQAGRRLLRETLLPLSALVQQGCPQPQEGVTYAAKISVQEGELRWDQPALMLERLVRAFAPTPGAWFSCDRKRVKVFKVQILEDSSAPPGTILDAQLTVACQKGSFRLLEVQPEGKGRMSGADFLRGRPALVGKRLRLSSSFAEKT
jgi:methionyl-tRNA formyltransferase